MLRLFKLILRDALGGLRGPSVRDILCSKEYQYAANEAARLEDERNAHAEENEQLSPLVQEYERMVSVLENYLMTASPEWAKMTHAEKLKAHLEGNNNLIRIERANAESARKNATAISEQAQREIAEAHGLMRDLREGTVPKEIFEAIIQRVPKATLILNPNLEITHYHAPPESHPHFELAKGMEYQELFSTRQGFNTFRSEMERLIEGQSFEAYTLLGNGGKRGDYVSSASPIITDRLFGYDISIRSETKLEWAKRKLSLTRKIISETELGTDALPELGKA